MSICIYLEHNDSRFEDVSLELAVKGRELADQAKIPLVGLILGSTIARLADEALQWGFDEVIVADHPLLQEYRTGSYTQAAAQILRHFHPGIFLVGATANGRDLASRLAVVFKTGLTADCTDLKLEAAQGEPILIGEVTGFGGGIAALIACRKARPQMATCRPGIFRAIKPEKGPRGKVTLREVEIDAGKIATEIIETHKEGSQVDVTRAKHLVIGGRGIHGDLKILRQLADLIGGDIAATRVAVDEGWVTRELQIGQTGYAVRPKVAIVCGVSGATQFTVGISGAGKVVAINNDSEAPIFESADYCVVGDLFQVLPALIEEIKKARVVSV